MQKGLTLIELMITVAIIGILAATSIILYNSQVRKGRRVDGLNAVTSLSLAQERYRSNHTTYGTLAQIGGSATSPEGYYSLSVTSPTATSYSITATGQGTQANDTSCSSLVLTMSNGTITKTPADCWPN